MSALLSVSNTFSGTITAYLNRQQSRGKDMVAEMNKLMAFWLLNAMRLVTKADPAAIHNRLSQKLSTGTRLPATRRKRAVVVDEMRNTRAAALISILNYGNARAMRKSGNVTGYFKLAKAFRQRREFASGLHKSGFVLGLKARFAKTDGSKVPRYSTPTGDSPSPIVTQDMIAMEVSNFAGIIAELFPDAFEKGAAELELRIGARLARGVMLGLQDAGQGT